MLPTIKCSLLLGVSECGWSTSWQLHVQWSVRIMPPLASASSVGDTTLGSLNPTSDVLRSSARRKNTCGRRAEERGNFVGCCWGSWAALSTAPDVAAQREETRAACANMAPYAFVDATCPAPRRARTEETNLVKAPWMGSRRALSSLPRATVTMAESASCLAAVHHTEVVFF